MKKTDGQADGRRPRYTGYFGKSLVAAATLRLYSDH